MRTYSTIFLDLDDTLYPADSGVWEAIRGRIDSFLEQRMSLSSDDAGKLRRDFTRRYGTTLRGLIEHFEVDPHEYMEYVHDLPLPQMLDPDQALQRMLARLPQDILIFTNADQAHAGRVLHALGIGNQIDGVIGYFELAPFNKPNPQAYARALRLAGGVNPQKCVLADDQLRNLEPACLLGMTTVLVGDRAPEGTTERQITRITDLVECLPALMQPLPKEGVDARA